MILIYNHPSGNLKASKADIALTRKFVKTGVLLEIVVLDHLIITSNDFLSFVDDGLI